MSRLLVGGGLILAIGATAFVLWQYEIVGLDQLQLKPRATAGGGTTAGVPGLPAPPADPRTAIRIATLNVNPLDREKLSKPHVLGCLVRLVRQFDILALQGVEARDPSVLVQLLEKVNAEGRHYDYAVPDNVAGGSLLRSSAFVFDRATVEIDRQTLGPVDDPQGRFRFPPLVAAFRVRGPSAAEAFTFTLVNVHVDPPQAITELALLDDVFRAVLADGRNEDDVILLGDLAADERNLGPLRRLPDIAWVISGTPTTLKQARSVDNVLFDLRATREYTGRAGVIDVVRECRLKPDEAADVSEHLPVWAEFSAYEGGQAGQLVERSAANATK